ncbi:MAG TPA: hypothetical protein VK910_04810 [Thiobacillus sp.]|nr:hypothetical protein [Thiobacillus sp.]
MKMLVQNSRSLKSIIRRQCGVAVGQSGVKKAGLPEHASVSVRVLPRKSRRGGSSHGRLPYWFSDRLARTAAIDGDAVCR